MQFSIRRYLNHLSNPGNTFPIWRKKKPPTFQLMEEIRDVVMEEGGEENNRPKPFPQVIPSGRVGCLTIWFHAVSGRLYHKASQKHNATFWRMQFILGTSSTTELIRTWRRLIGRWRGGCKPAVALPSVSRAARAWTDNIELALRQGIDSDQVIKTLDGLKLASEFIA